MTTNDDKTPRQDIYSRITNQIIEALEQGVKPWTQPWNAAHAAGHVSRPVVPENSIHPESRGEAESGHHQTRCSLSST